MKTNRRKIINDLAKEIKTPNQNLAKLKTMIKQISKLPIDMNTRIYKGRTLLHYAVIGNNSGVINLLSKAGVNPNICDDNYNTPLHFAILSEFEQTPLHKAVILGNLDIIKLLIKYGADPELVDEKNQSPLDYAQDEGDQEIIKYLVATLKRQKGE